MITEGRMAYYTDEDRRRAAVARKRNQQFRRLVKSPEDSFDIWGIKVPKVSVEPQLADYGLFDGVEEQLKIMNDESVAKRKENRSLIAWLVIIFFAIGCIWFGVQSDSIGAAIGIFFVIGLYPLIFLWGWASDDKPEQTSLHMQYDSYKNQMRYYHYWQRKKDKNHWNKMSGHAFEQAVANLFRSIGFTAEVSRRGGDGGVDIILEKASRRIAVQCKRYKSAVGPHVMRDLWGTMHYLGFDEGCIVTTTGFTKGVTDFAVGKKIYLVDLNDILRANNDNEEEYLKRKIGENGL